MVGYRYVSQCLNLPKIIFGLCFILAIPVKTIFPYLSNSEHKACLVFEFLTIHVLSFFQFSYFGNQVPYKNLIYLALNKHAI